MIPYIIPLGLTLYLYIEEKFGRYLPDANDVKYVKKRIFDIIGFISFLCAYASVIFSVLSDDSFAWHWIYILVMIIFIGAFIFFVVKYFEHELELSKRLKFFELVILVVAIGVIVCNIYLR